MAAVREEERREAQVRHRRGAVSKRGDRKEFVPLGLIGRRHGRHGPAHEAVETFVRRRGRAAGCEQAKLGRWSTLWANAVIGWDSHLQRDRNSKTWSSQLRLLSTPADLQQRRCVLGRPQTRAQSGFIRTRWFEAVEAAKEWVADN